MAVVADPSNRWDRLADAVGTSLGTSPPLVVDQATVDQHAATTGDAQWIHNDPERARAEGPFGGPIVQGFLLLSLLTRLSGGLDLGLLAAGGPLAMTVNYGFDRVRFVGPVPVGAAVRLRAELGEVRPRADGSAVLALDAVLEVLPADDAGPGAATVPAVRARWLFLAVPAADTPPPPGGPPTG